MQRIQQEKRLGEEAKTDPRKKLIWMMMRAKNMKMRQIEEEERKKLEAEKAAALKSENGQDGQEEIKDGADGEEAK